MCGCVCVWVRGCDCVCGAFASVCLLVCASVGACVGACVCVLVQARVFVCG